MVNQLLGRPVYLSLASLTTGLCSLWGHCASETEAIVQRDVLISLRAGTLPFRQSLRAVSGPLPTGLCTRSRVGLKAPAGYRPVLSH